MPLGASGNCGRTRFFNSGDLEKMSSMPPETDESPTRQLVRQRLKASGARYINFFAPLEVERLEP